jgi:hypothetical protein
VAAQCFLRPARREAIWLSGELDRRIWEAATLLALRDRLRAGDIWVEGSRQWRAVEDQLRPSGPSGLQSGHGGGGSPGKGRRGVGPLGKAPSPTPTPALSEGSEPSGLDSTGPSAA